MARYREVTPLGRWVGDGSEEELDVFAAERYFNGDDALWYARSSSAFRTGTTTHEHGRSSVAAATSSSEASWNSRSALLTDGKKVPVPAPSAVEAESRGTGSERPRGKPPPPCHLRRWLLGVAARACVGGDGEQSASDDEVEDDDSVGGSKVADGVGEMFRGTGRSKELAVRVRPGRSLRGGDDFLAGQAAFSPVRVQLAGDVHRQPVNSGEFSTPILNQATTTTGPSPPERRRKSSETLRQHGVVLSTKKQDSAFTIVAGGNTAASGGGGGLHAAATAHGGQPPGTSRCDSSEDDTAPSEASVVWSVVTAEGAASCNFSSAASGYHHHLNGVEDGAVPQTAPSRRRSGVTNGGGFLTCRGDKAVDAVRPARWPVVEPASVGRPGARNGSRNRPSAESTRRR